MVDLDLDKLQAHNCITHGPCSRNCCLPKEFAALIAECRRLREVEKAANYVAEILRSRCGEDGVAKRAIGAYDAAKRKGGE
jgi:hypothetical protein